MVSRAAEEEIDCVVDAVRAELFFFFFSSRRRHTRYWRDWSSECALPIFSRWRKGLSATNAGIALPPSGETALPVPGLERTPRRWRRLTPRRVIVGTVKSVFTLGTAEIGRASCRERV